MNYLLPYALLATTRKEKDGCKNRIEFYIPFFMEGINALFSSRHDSIPFTEINGAYKQIRFQIQKKSFLDLPTHIIRHLFDIAINKKIIKVNNLQIFQSSNFNKFLDLKINRKKKNITKEIDNLINQFTEYHNQQVDQPLKRKEAENILAFHIENNSKEILEESIELKHNPSTISKTKKYLFAKYIKFLQDNPTSEHRTIFQTLYDLNIGYIVNQILTSDEQLGKIKKPVVYVDSTLILHAITENSSQQIAQEFFSEIKSSNIELRMFVHSYDEGKRIIQRAIHTVQSIRNGSIQEMNANRTVRYLLDDDIDTEVFFHEYDKFIKQNSIDVNDGDINATIDEDEYQYFIDEQELETLLLNDDEGRNRQSVQLDIKSITKINQLRKNRLPTTFDETKYLFVTDNTSLSKNSRIIEKKHLDKIKNIKGVPCCLTDTRLFTILWLNGKNNLDKLNKITLYKHCFAYIELSDVQVEDIKRKAKKWYEEKKIDEDLLARIFIDQSIDITAYEIANNDNNSLYSKQEESIQAFINKYTKQEQDLHAAILNKDKKIVELEDKNKELIKQEKDRKAAVSRKREKKTIQWITAGIFSLLVVAAGFLVRLLETISSLPLTSELQQFLPDLIAKVSSFMIGVVISGLIVCIVPPSRRSIKRRAQWIYKKFKKNAKYQLEKDRLF